MSTHVRRRKNIKTNLNECLRIPKSVFDRTLEVINDPQHDVWKDRNSACYKPIHRYENRIRGMRSEEHSDKMCLARTSLLTRDIRNLGKTLAISNPSGGRSDCKWYPLCVKYGVLCLAHSNQRLLNLFLQSLIASDSNEGFLERYTKHSNNLENSDS